MRTFWVGLIAILSLSACSSAEDELSVESKPMCIVEVAKRLQACEANVDCEKGVARFAGYCYNTAKGEQTDICRGGMYFFERPLKELALQHEAVANLSKKHRRIIVDSGEVYCNFNYN